MTYKMSKTFIVEKFPLALKAQKNTREELKIKTKSILFLIKQTWPHRETTCVELRICEARDTVLMFPYFMKCIFFNYVVSNIN